MKKVNSKIISSKSWVLLFIIVYAGLHIGSVYNYSIKIILLLSAIQSIKVIKQKIQKYNHQTTSYGDTNRGK